MPRPRPGFELFAISLLVLFLELACIRWFPAHVIFLSFFTNTMLLAGFVGMSIGCLIARQKTNHIRWTPLLLLIALLSGLMVERYRETFQSITNVGNQANPEVVFFGAETGVRGDLEFKFPVEIMAGIFFALVAAVHVGPGQEMGRAFNRIANRTTAYSMDLLGSLAGIGLFALCSQLQWPPMYWFAFASIPLGYLFWQTGRPFGNDTPLRKFVLRPLPYFFLVLCLLITIPTSLSGFPQFTFGREVRWSPYYRIDRDRGSETITTNQTGHQRMIARGVPTQAPYDLPYLFRKALDRPQFERILVIGSGSGNDISRALYWCGPNAKIDAVEIDPVIRQYGIKHHPDKPYDDPRITRHLNDGRNFLRQAETGTYDLVVFALVDSLVLHSGYSSIRLESFLFTEESFRDVKRVLKPDGMTAVYNFFRQGWIMARLREVLRDVFDAEPVALVDPPFKGGEVPLDYFFKNGGDAVFFAGGKEAIDPLRAKFTEVGPFWVPAAPTEKYDGGQNAADAIEVEARPAWVPMTLTTIQDSGGTLVRATDDWPFLYVRKPGIPDLTWRGAAIILGLSLALWAAFRYLGGKDETNETTSAKNADETGLALRAFMLGAGFMLIETKAVVQMALLFGSTWVVNTFVFAAILVMAMLGNLYAGKVQPKRLEPYYLGLFAAIALGLAIPLQWFLGMNPILQTLAACGLVFAPILFAGVIFPTSFARTSRPDRFFGANVAGALVGGLAENASMLLGFQYLLIVALGFYLLSACFGNRSKSG